MARYTTTALILATACTILASCSNPPQVDSLWNREFTTAQQIVEIYDSIRNAIGRGNSNMHTRNLCHYVWNSGEYMFRCRGKNEDVSLLPEPLDELILDDSTVTRFMIERDTARFVDHYFTLEAMKRGDSFEESRDGITITVFYKPRAMNGNDYAKMRRVFSCSNSALHQAYMRKLKFPFRNSGCNEQLYSIRPLIENNVEDSKLKSEIIALYDEYSGIMPGSPAPTPTLVDTKGKEHTIAEFRGKVLVIDVWATWCSSCLANMPKFISLKESYKDNKQIEFITISIDRKNARGNWLSTIAKRKMECMLNLYPHCDVQSQFESDYHISGVPRYIVIDSKGNIVSAFAPPPSQGLEQIIAQTLEQ